MPKSKNSEQERQPKKKMKENQEEIRSSHCVRIRQHNDWTTLSTTSAREIKFTPIKRVNQEYIVSQHWK